MKRESGILMHVSSLPGEYGIGGFSYGNAVRFIDLIKDCGFSVWQVLPFGPADEYNSPYKSYSAFAGNPNFIDLEALFEDGLITKEELLEAHQETPFLCEFEKLSNTRTELLKKAAKRVNDRNRIINFVEDNKYIREFCKFMAIREKNNGAEWTEWENNEYDPETEFAWQFMQYTFFFQWFKIRGYAAKNGIKIIGDLPIYVSMDSSDVWAEPQQFLLDEDNKPKLVAGVPPDYFAEDGQLWGNPLYDWAYMEKCGFSWWKDRIAWQMKLFDGVRLDHFRGFEAYWAVPGGAETAKEGHWEAGPREKLIDAVKEAAGDGLIIAEDLGDITPEVEALRDYSGFPGMRVFQFAFLSRENPHLPHSYIKNSVAYTGTHDNNTLLGYLWEIDPMTRREVMDYCACPEDWDRYGCRAIVKTMLQSSADLVIFPIQDILGYGSDTRMNTPGKAKGNWAYRVTWQQLESIDRGYLKYLNNLYRR